MERHIIIGAGSGIGAALARKLAAPGTDLLLHTGQNDARLSGVATACEAAGARVSTCLGLTEDPELAARVAGWLDTVPDNGLTGFTFAAGYAKLGTLGQMQADDLRTALEAMPMAFHRLATLADGKLAEGRGRMLCVSAFGAHRSKTHSYGPTAPAKAALEAQIRVFAANLAPRGITANALVPGFIQKEPGTQSSLTPGAWAKVTASIPMARLGRPEEVAALGAFLLSAEAGYITGQSLHVNGGLTL